MIWINEKTFHNVCKWSNKERDTKALCNIQLAGEEDGDKLFHCTNKLVVGDNLCLSFLRCKNITFLCQHKTCPFLGGTWCTIKLKLLNYFKYRLLYHSKFKVLHTLKLIFLIIHEPELVTRILIISNSNFSNKIMKVKRH